MPIYWAFCLSSSCFKDKQVLRCYGCKAPEGQVRVEVFGVRLSLDGFSADGFRDAFSRYVPSITVKPLQDSNVGIGTQT
jgi:hypothetical protein